MNNLNIMELSSDSEVDIIDTCYNLFKEDMLKKENRPELFGKFIYIPIEWNRNKAEAFWHASSLEPKDNLNIFPCNNDYSSSLCNNNCLKQDITITLKNGDTRLICYYRMVRVHWIKKIIELANNNDARVQYWEVTKKDKQIKLYIRYTFINIDYVVILGVKPNQYVFITAYPVFFIDAKTDFTKDYNKYKK